MQFLIDGYNLMFTLGLLGRHTGRKALERARADLIAWLRQTQAKRHAKVTLVFDGRESASEAADEHVTDDLHVLFSVGQTADDAIAELIRNADNPRKLVVVSSDHRIQNAAKRRHSVVWDSADYIDWALEDGHAPPKAGRRVDKPGVSSPADAIEWLREFGAVDADPDVKRFNRPFEDFRDPK